MKITSPSLIVIVLVCFLVAAFAHQSRLKSQARDPAKSEQALRSFIQ